MLNSYDELSNFSKVSENSNCINNNNDSVNLQFSNLRKFHLIISHMMCTNKNCLNTPRGPILNIVVKNV